MDMCYNYYGAIYAIVAVKWISLKGLREYGYFIYIYYNSNLPFVCYFKS